MSCSWSPDSLASSRLFLRRYREVGGEQTLAELDAQRNAVAILSKFQDDLNLIEKSVQSYNRTSNPAALDEAVAAWERILNHPDLSRADQSLLFAAMNEAGNVPLQRYLAWGKLPDLSRALDLFRQAAAATPEGHPNLPTLLNNLGNCLINLYERLGHIEDLEEAIGVLRQLPRPVIIPICLGISTI